MNPQTEQVNIKFPKEDSTFVARLRWLAAQRSITRLMKDSGWSGGTIDRTLNEDEFMPGTAMLVAMANVENASLDWLAEGRGAPFRVVRCQSCSASADYLHALLDESGWDATLYTSDHVDPVIVLAQPGSLIRGKNAIRYTVLEIVAGPLDAQALALLAPLQRVRSIRVDSYSLANLAAGATAGSYLLTRAPTPPFAATAAADTLSIAETAAQYAVAESQGNCGLSADELKLVQTYRSFSQHGRGLAQHLLDALQAHEVGASPQPPAQGTTASK